MLNKLSHGENTKTAQASQSNVQVTVCMPVETVQRVSHLCQEYCTRATNLPCSPLPLEWYSLRYFEDPETGPARGAQSPPASAKVCCSRGLDFNKHLGKKGKLFLQVYCVRRKQDQAGR